MRYLHNFFRVFIIFVLGLPLLAYADRAIVAQAQPQRCPIEETATISISFNGIESDIKKIKGLIDSKVEEIRSIAAKADIGDIQIQNYNYNVYGNSNNNNGCGMGVGSPSLSFQFNSNFGFVIKPADKATELATLLNSKGYNVSLNVNGYQRC